MIRITPDCENDGFLEPVWNADKPASSGKVESSGSGHAPDPCNPTPPAPNGDPHSPPAQAGAAGELPAASASRSTARTTGSDRRPAIAGPGAALHQASSQRHGSPPLYQQHNDPQVLRAATALVVLVEQAFRRSTERPDLMPVEYATLRYIAQLDAQGTTVAAVARTFNFTTPTSVSLFRRLADRELIFAEFPEGRQRGRRAWLTTSGWQALQSDPLQHALADLFSDLNVGACRVVFESLIRTGYAQSRWHELGFGVEFWR